jgi:hypothetical protein
MAQAILPGPRSTGCFGLVIPLAGALALVFRGVEPAAAGVLVLLQAARLLTCLADRSIGWIRW